MKQFTIALIKFSFKFFGTIPLPILRFLGKAFGLLTWILSKRYRSQFKSNWSQAEKADKSRKMQESSFFNAIANSGQILFETAKIWTYRDTVSLVEKKGINLIKEAVKAHNGLIFLTPHLGAFELAPRILSEYTSLTVMYRPPKHEDLHELLVYFRAAENIELVKTDYAGVKSLIKSLKSGNCIGILPDQVPQRGAGKWTPFFERLAYTNTLVIRIAKLTSAPIAWVSCVESPKGWSFSVHIWDLKFDKNSDENEGLIKLNNKLEELIYEHPEQYLWGYDRFKKPR